MESVVLKAHYDGKNILLDEEYKLEPNTKLLVTVIEDEDKEKEGFYFLSQKGLSGAYSEDEAEYPLTLVKERNPEYERR